MKPLPLFIIGGLIFSSFSVQGEVTFDESTVTDEEVSGQLSQCTTLENEFQKYVIDTMDGSLRGFTQSYDCLTREAISRRPDCVKLNRGNLNHLKRFRKSIGKLYQEMTDTWVEEEGKKDGGYARNCLMTPKGVQMGQHIRRPKLIQSASLCQSVLTKWSHEQDLLTSEYLSGKRKARSLNKEELEALRAFHKSSMKRMLPDVALYDQRLSDKQLKHHLAVTYNRMKFGTEKLKGKIEKFSDHERFKLYEFGQQHRLFVETLEDDKRKDAVECQQKSHFGRDCVLDIDKHLSRCGSRLWSIGVELLPVIPLINSLSGMGEVMAAEVSGVMTSGEATEKRSDLMTMAVFGIGGFSGGALSAKFVIKEIRELVRSARDKGIDYSRDNIILKVGERDRTTHGVQRGVLRSKKRSGTDSDLGPVTKQKLIKAHNREIERLAGMGIQYREIPNIEGYVIRELRANFKDVWENPHVSENVRQAMIEGTVRGLGFDFRSPPVKNVLRIEKVASGKKHDRSLGPALSHRNMEARIREAEARGVRVVVDTSLENTKDRGQITGYYDTSKRILAIRSNSSWHVFEHEFQHMLFDTYIRDDFQSMGKMVRFGIGKGQSSSEMRNALPDRVRRNWTQREQDTIIRYLKDDLPENSLNERLSVDRQLSVLGWRRYTPYGQRVGNYATRHLINDLDSLESLTPRQLGIRNRASVTYRTRRAYYRGPQIVGRGLGRGAKLGAEALGITASEIVIKEGLRGSVDDMGNEGESAILPRKIQSAIADAEEILFSEKGLLVRKSGGEVVFIPNNQQKSK